MLKRGAEAVAVVLLATMFVAFLIQIVFRYVLNWPVGWTSEVSTAMWLWAVLWGAAFVVDEREEIRFDILYAAVGTTIRRVFDALTSTALIIVYAISLPAIAGYISFVRVERTDYLRVPFSYVFAIYVPFAVAAIARYCWVLWRAIVPSHASPPPTAS
jgi:TRAP-type C4-dicarboxylate transport system permease small subunit